MARDEDITFNQIVHCYEYGTTRALGNETEVSPATRMGNVTRTRNLQELYGEAGETMLELSFPALLGASGSPVVQFTGKEVMLWGILKSNISYELLPAQIETVLDDKNNILQEIRYLLPQSVAINVKHLSKLVREMGLPQAVESP